MSAGTNYQTLPALRNTHIVWSHKELFGHHALRCMTKPCTTAAMAVLSKCGLQ